MKGEAVTIRTIDPPLHEFLPKREELMVDDRAARGDRARAARSSTRRRSCSRRVEQLHEFNPMLGHRGVRLGITYPEITEMQTRAIMEAACQLNKEGLKVVPEIMIPLVGHVKELRDQKAIVDRVAAAGDEGAGRQGQVPGRHDDRGAARRDDRRSRSPTEAQFFSFGTNDLTQMTFGFSRDDIGKFLRVYQDKKILDKDPFATIDTEGVGAARADRRRARPQRAAAI